MITTVDALLFPKSAIRQDPNNCWAKRKFGSFHCSLDTYDGIILLCIFGLISMTVCYFTGNISTSHYKRQSSTETLVITFHLNQHILDVCAVFFASIAFVLTRWQRQTLIWGNYIRKLRFSRYAEQKSNQRAKLCQFSAMKCMTTLILTQ